MKKAILSASIFLLQLTAFSQNMFGNDMSKAQKEIESWFGPVMSGLWLIGAIISYGVTMTGADKDVKKFLGGILITTVAVGFLIAGYSYINSKSL